MSCLTNKCFTEIQKIKSKGAVLTLFLAFLVCSSFMTLLWATTIINYGKDELFLLYAPGAAALLLLAISCPIAGWLADVYFGRYKVMQAGLWLMWIGFIMTVITLTLLSTFEGNHHVQHILWYSGASVVIILVPVGFASFIVSALQFGTDQIPEASSDELSAFIHWAVWVGFVGNFVARLTNLIGYCTNNLDSNHDKYVSASLQCMVPVTMLSLAICCDNLLHEWFAIEPGSRNPLKTIVQVIKFAAMHKFPIRRRAITYCEDLKPSRIDYAKDRYGGPFTTEQVEDVKTCFRIIVVVVSTTMIIVPLFLYNISFNYLLLKFTMKTCSLRRKELGFSPSVFAVIMIPIFELLVYPRMRNRIPSMLKRVGIAATLLVILTINMFITNIVKHALNPETQCMFNMGPKTVVVNPELWQHILSNIITAIELVLYCIAILEFTYAQSPYSMRGLLVGLVYSVGFSIFPISYVIFTAWEKFPKQVEPSCDFYYFLFQFLCAVIGLIVFCTVARWYKRRQREEDYFRQSELERIFYERIKHNQRLRGETDWS